MPLMHAQHKDAFQVQMKSYRGRIAPTPTGYMHLGHAQTFLTAQSRARECGGTLVLRNEDIDAQRCRPEFVQAMYEDLKWIGIDWDEGPDLAGMYARYTQSARRGFYFNAWRDLLASGSIYPCTRSRKDVAEAVRAPHAEGEESVFPVAWRPDPQARYTATTPAGVNWRFRVPDNEVIAFCDQRLGAVSYTAGRDFGDFLVWRRDDAPAYELAVVVDDHAMDITEVVRGEDLLRSTARQLLLYRALGWAPPDFYHCSLVRDVYGKRLAKRDDALSLRELRRQGKQLCTLLNVPLPPLR